MTNANLKERDYIKAWAIFFVIAFVCGAVAGAIVGGIAGGILRALVGPTRFVSVVCGTLAFFVTLPISYFSFRFAVTKFLLPMILTPETAVAPLKAAA